MTVAYLAADGFEQELEAELGARTIERWERLFLARPGRRPAWAQNVWFEPQKKRIASIKDAARTLTAVQRNWALASVAHHRRAALIQAQLPHVSGRPIAPYSQLPTAPLGSWALIERDTLIMSAHCESAFQNGVVPFVEDREGPPSRAYLKLWEALTLSGRWPSAKERVIDLGSAPGGWTWALAELGAQVTSVDKAPLADAVAARPNVHSIQASAFALDPSEHDVSWVFSDVICYPSRLLALVERWMKVHPQASFVCSIKRQGPPDAESVRRFMNIEGATVRHLSVNRHELTFMRFA